MGGGRSGKYVCFLINLGLFLLLLLLLELSGNARRLDLFVTIVEQSRFVELLFLLRELKFIIAR